jgi:hypothetical protein
MAKARKTDPSTSHQAAASVRNVTDTQKAILKALKRGLTDNDLLVAYRNLRKAPQASDSGIRSRRAELVAQELVADTGKRVKLPSGRNAIVWKAL